MFQEKLRALRLHAGMSQQGLAEAMGVSRTAVYKWEMGQGQPDIRTLCRLAELFHVTMDELCEQYAYTDQGAAACDNMALMTRAFRQLTEDEQEKYLAVGRALFAHAFDTEDKG